MKEYVFRQHIKTLTETTISELQAKSSKILLQQTALTNMISALVAQIKQTMLTSNRIINEKTVLIAEIVNGPLQTNKTLLKQHQLQNIQTSVSFMLVSKIAQNKKDIDRLNNDISIIKQKISSQSKRASGLLREQQTIQKSLDEIEVIIGIYDFLVANGTTPESLAQNEITYWFERYVMEVL